MLAVVPLPEEAPRRAGGRKGRRTSFIIVHLSAKCKGKPPQKRPRTPYKRDMTDILEKHKKNDEGDFAVMRSKIRKKS
jgi:hypothetical protein